MAQTKAKTTAIDIHNSIIIKGARVHNLKQVELTIPKNKLVVITGLSGSGKSSLAFDTLFAEGQRRYVESLSAYARQFLGRMNKPEVDHIHGLAPAIAIEQKVNNKNPRSTVGTSSEIYEYLKLLYARTGKTISPVSGMEVKRHTEEDVISYVLDLPESEKVAITFCIPADGFRKQLEQYKLLLQQGYARVLIHNEVMRIEALIDSSEPADLAPEINVVVDRLMVTHGDDEFRSRLFDTIQTAFHEGHGQCKVYCLDTGQEAVFNHRFELDGITFIEPTENLFSFNNPFGACPTCEGFGSVIGIDEDMVIPDRSLSVYDHAVLCWRGGKMSEWRDQLIMHAEKVNFPVHRPYHDLTEKEKELLWNGCKHFKGIYDFFKYVEKRTYKIQYRVMLARYRGKTVCNVCRGGRLREEATYVKTGGQSISDLVRMPVSDLADFFRRIELSEHDKQLSTRIFNEINNRLQCLMDVGLGYLTLNRLSSTLSGGESQRINLATSLGSNLVGSLYVLDEPSIGLHARDVSRLLKVLRNLRDLGNTVLVVEHDEEVMRAADYIVDIGPEAGSHGGEIVFAGVMDDLLAQNKTLTARYLNRHLKIPTPASRKKWTKAISVIGAREHNLKGDDFTFPLNTLTVVTGVSGSGKSSLVRNILYVGLMKQLSEIGEKVGKHSRIEGSVDKIGAVEFVDQNPIGRSSRSNPATYVKAFDDIRALFADVPLARVRGYKPGFFSFNVPGGRCEECEGEGVVHVSMQFMADVELICESCQGKRYQDEVLDVEYQGKNINQVLNMTVDDALDFFNDSNTKHGTVQKIVGKLQPLQAVGMGYVKLGQSSSTLSGGEAQRIKLALYLARGVKERPSMFIFDEPTTGLHFHDIHKLYYAFTALIKQGHTLVVIEHNLEVVKCADWVIDLGPEGGEMGGRLVFQGTPEDLIKCEASYTGKYLGRLLP